MSMGIWPSILVLGPIGDYANPFSYMMMAGSKYNSAE